MIHHGAGGSGGGGGGPDHSRLIPVATAWQGERGISSKGPRGSSGSAEPVWEGIYSSLGRAEALAFWPCLDVQSRDGGYRIQHGV